jgi:hypothetical protein
VSHFQPILGEQPERQSLKITTEAIAAALGMELALYRWKNFHSANTQKECLMRALIFLVAIVLLLALAGWISFSNSSGRSSINIETQKIEQDTDRAMETGSNLLRKAGDAVDHANEPAPETVPVTSAPVSPSPVSPAPVQ